MKELIKIIDMELESYNKLLVNLKLIPRIKSSDLFHEETIISLLTVIKKIAIREQEKQEKIIQVYVTAAQNWEERFRAGIQGEQERIVKALNKKYKHPKGGYYIAWLPDIIKIVKGE